MADAAILAAGDDSAPATADQDWKAALPDEFRSDPTLAKYPSVAELAKGHVNQAKLVGAKFDLSKPEIRKQIGVPDAPDGYAFDLAETDHPYLTPDNAKALLAPEFHKAGLTAAQAKGVAGGLVSALKAQHQKLLQQYETGHAEWKAAVGDQKYQTETAVADMTINTDTAVGKKLDPDGAFRTILESTGLIRNPDVLRFLSRVGAEFQEDAARVSDVAAGGKMTPEQARAEYAAILSDPKHQHYEGFKRGDKAAQAYVESLYRRAYGAGTVDLSPSVFSVGPREE